MNANVKSSDRLWELINAHFSEVDDPAQKAELESMLRDNVNSLELFKSVCQMHAELFLTARINKAYESVSQVILGSDPLSPSDSSEANQQIDLNGPSLGTAGLREEFAGRKSQEQLISSNLEAQFSPGAPAEDNSSEQEPSIATAPPSRPIVIHIPGLAQGLGHQPSQLFGVLLGTCISLLAVGILMLIVRPRPDALGVPGHDIIADWGANDGAADDSAELAMIDGQQGVQWAAGTRPHLERTAIKPGETLRIDSGIVDLTLKNGVRLSIEGPADWSVDGNNLASLRLGKLVADVPAGAIGFTLDTPTMEIVDLGTRFGVEVSGTQTELHVLTGQVEAKRRIGKRGKHAAPVRLTAGQSVRMRSGGGQMESIAARPALFATGREWPKESPLERWHKSSRNLRKEDSLIAYYDFEQKGAVLKDATQNGLDGRIESVAAPPWTHGRWYGKGALAFGDRFAPRITVEDDPRLRLDDKFSIVVWLRPDESPKKAQLIVGKGEYPARNFSLWIVNYDDPGQVAFSVFSSAGENLDVTTAETLPIGRWSQLVGVVDETNLRVYLNGNACQKTVTVKRPLMVDASPMRIGKSIQPGYDSALDGVIDEIAIFRRALSADEIQTLYEAGRNE